MAASLMEIKSRMLLPRGQAATGEGDDDDPLDPRWELVHQLLQYKKFKEAAAKIDELAAFQRDMLARHVVEVAATENERPLKPVDRIELWNVFNLVLRRLSEKLVVGEIKGEEVTVSDKMEELLKLIETRKAFLFTDLFEGKQVTVRLLVATFIAVLELTRLKKLRVRQDEAYADIHVEAVENTVNADGSLAEGQLNFSPEAPSTEPTVAGNVTLSPAFTEAAPADEPSVPEVETPPLVLTATGYAEIPSVIGADTSPATENPEQSIEMPPEAQADSPLPIFDTAAEDAPETSLAAAEPLVEAAENPAPPEQILPQNPLDTEPPRDTFTS
jgi:segregation and condensation protein A